MIKMNSNVNSLTLYGNDLFKDLSASAIKKENSVHNVHVAPNFSLPVRALQNAMTISLEGEGHTKPMFG